VASLRELTTNQKGAIAEAAITKAAVELGVEVYRPVVEGGRYDLIFVTASELIRVQCKWASLCNDVLQIRCYSCRRAREGMRMRTYTSEEVDAFAAYSSHTGRCYFLPPSLWSARRGVYLRLVPTRNNQSRCINWARDYEFGATLRLSQGP
jgi:PD-(D/E)XK nuclease superfamily protein